MHTLSLRELIQSLRAKQFSSLELITHYLNRIENAHHLNAFISIDKDQALKNAMNADLILHQKKENALTGIPVAHKDNFCTKELLTTCGSKMLANFQSPYDATIVKRLREQGSILIGKTNMDEFAMGSANENSYYGPVQNPWDITRVPGGSSGGSAASVAAGLIPFATGSDTGGSIRQPAAFCGISGLKPTYGLISRFGMVAYASSLDQAGPIAKSADDLALILQSMAGFDTLDSTSVNKPLPDYTAHINAPLKSLRIGIPSCFFHTEVHDDIQQAVLAAAKIFEQAGATLIEIELPLQPLWVPCYYILACAEASSNLARFDGVRFGFRTSNADNIQQLITRSRSEGFGLEVKRRILLGTHVLMSGYFDDYYVQAQKVRRMIKMELEQAFLGVDFILGPTTPTCAFKQGEAYQNPTQAYLADAFTVAANLAGIPAISIPGGFSEGSWT